MTLMFDDGTAEIYKLKNVAGNGNMPEEKLVKVAAYDYGEDTVYYSRFYEAKQAGVRADRLIHIEDHAHELLPGKEKLVAIVDDEMYTIEQTQFGKSDGLPVTWLTLQRTVENYEYHEEA